MKYIKRFLESNVDRNYNKKALTNEEDTYIMTIDEWEENMKNAPYDRNEVISHWAKDGYYDKNTNAFSSDPMDATHVWIRFRTKS